MPFSRKLQPKTLRTYQTLALLIAVALVFVPLIAQASVGGFFYNEIVLPLFGMLLGWSAIILNWSVNEFVIGFGNQFSGTGIGAVVDTTWSTVRDLFNLTFIFGLVYIGFKMILGTDSGDTRRWLANIVIAALLVNFSLFVSKFIVDTSNILAVEILNIGIFVQDPPLSGKVDFSGSMMNQMQTITSVNLEDKIEKDGEDDIGFSTIFGTMMLFIVTAFVFMSAGVLLIIRAAVLIILMILSPFLFIGLVLPMFKGLARSLWRRLLSNAFVAPIYIFFMYLTLSIMEGFFDGPVNPKAPDGGFGAATAAPEGGVADAAYVSSVAGTFGPFIVATVLMMMSLVVAKKMGADGASGAMAAGNRLQKRGRRMMGGYAARGMNRAAEGYQKQYDRMGNSRTGRVARGALALGTLGALSDKGIKAGRNYKVTGQESHDEKRKRKEGMTARSSAQKRKDERGRDRQSDNQNTRAAAFAAMSTEELGNMSARERAENARFMTNGQIDNLETEGKVTAAEADNLRTEREEQSFQAFNDTFADVDASAVQFENAIAGMTKAIDNIPDERLAEVAQRHNGQRLTDPNFARMLSDEKMDVMRQNLDPDDFETLRQTRKDAQIDYAATGRVAGMAETDAAAEVAAKNRQRLFQNAQKVGNSPAEVFRDPRNRDMITTRAIEERIRNGISEEHLYGTDDEPVEINDEVVPGVVANIQNHIDGVGEGDDFTPEMRERRARTWRQWSQRSDNAGALGLNTAAPAAEAAEEPRIVLDTNMDRAREARDNNNNT